MKTLWLLVLLVACTQHTPIVYKEDTECWEPSTQNGYPFGTKTYALIGKAEQSYILQRCKWVAYGGLVNANMRLDSVDTITVPLIKMFETHITRLPAGRQRIEYIEVPSP